MCNDGRLPNIMVYRLAGVVFMHGERMWHTLRLFTILSAAKRTQYIKEHNIFHSMGEQCLIMKRKLPLYSKLISMGNNVRLASGVSFLTHDITHSMLNNVDEFIVKRGGY